MQDLQAAVQELHVYEAELQIQNEELLGSREQIEESQKKYFRHFDLAPVGLIRLNHEGLILETNILGAQMLGVNRITLHNVARSFLAHVVPESAGMFQQHLDSALASGHVEVCELVLRSAKRPDIFVRMQSVFICGDRETREFYTTLTDLTERQAMEQRIVQQKVLADAALVSKELFFAMLSHELRTPLTPLLALVHDLAADTGRSAEDLAIFTIMRRNLDLEVHLIDDLLDFTRINSGKLAILCQTTDLHHCLTNAVEICRNDVFVKGLDIDANLAAESHFVDADAGRITQLFWNLIKNAVKFTAAPGRITIKTWSDTAPHVSVEFVDTGVGIDAEQLSHIFNPFFQVDSNIKQRVGGLGLGLAICKSIAEAHGGTLTATSVGIGQGTTFRFVLPTIAASEAASQVVPVWPSEVRHEGLRLLLVEDHEDSRRVLARLLRRRGYYVAEARESSEARALCTEETFDILISDIGLPGDTGYDVLKELNARYGLPGIAMTGFGFDTDVARGKEAGFEEYLIKPISAKTLDGSIQRVASRLFGPSDRGQSRAGS